jgi:hypothetical protein
LGGEEISRKEPGRSDHRAAVRPSASFSRGPVGGEFHFVPLPGIGFGAESVDGLLSRWNVLGPAPLSGDVALEGDEVDAGAPPPTGAVLEVGAVRIGDAVSTTPEPA